MSDIISKIDTIKYSIYKKQQEMTQIKELEKLLNSPFINKNDIQIIENRILELKSESLNNNLKGIDKLKKFRLDSKKTSQINDEVQFIYPNFLEAGKTTMVFGESGIGKTLFMLAFANYALLNKNIASVISLDFDNGLKSLKKRKYDNLAEKWGEGVFDYLIGSQIIQEMEPLCVLKELALDGEKNKDKMIIIDSGSHFVYDGSKNERQRLKEFIDVVRTLKNQGASPIIIHHSHRVRDTQVADYHGSFEWCQTKC